MAQVVTRLVPFGLDAYGWKYRGRDGEIHISSACTSFRLTRLNAPEPRYCWIRFCAVILSG